MDIAKLLLIGVGGYVLYQVFQGQDNQVVGILPTTEPANVVPAVTTPSAVPAFKARVLEEMSKNGDTRTTMDADNWGYYYQRAYGVAGPDPDNIGLPSRGLLMTIDEWIGRIQPLSVVGLSGLRLGGVNTVAVATGYEMLNIRDVN